jgi:hypothetical protein
MEQEYVQTRTKGSPRTILVLFSCAEARIAGRHVCRSGRSVAALDSCELISVMDRSARDSESKITK